MLTLLKWLAFFYIFGSIIDAVFNITGSGIRSIFPALDHSRNIYTTTEKTAYRKEQKAYRQKQTIIFKIIKWVIVIKLIVFLIH